MMWRISSGPRNRRIGGRGAAPGSAGGVAGGTPGRPLHPSPNSGVAEAAFAAALGVRLGGVNTYGSRTEHRARLGRGRAPEAPDILGAVALGRDVTRGLIASLLAIAAVARRASARPRAGT